MSNNREDRYTSAGQALGGARFRNRPTASGGCCCPIIVEGINDRIALQSMGFTGPIEQVNRGWDQSRFIVYIFEKTAYISDINDLSIVNVKKLKNLNYLILDCFRIKKHLTHFNFEEALFVHEKLKPKKTILTNLHQDLDYNLLLKRLPKNILPAYDGLTINL